jgi:hypothetical protein
MSPRSTEQSKRAKDCKPSASTCARPSCCFLRTIQNNQRLTGFISLRIYLKSIRGLCPKYLIQGSLLGARFASSARSDTVFEDVRGGAHRPRPARAVARTPRGLPRIASRRRMADYTWRLAPPVCDKRAKAGTEFNKWCHSRRRALALNSKQCQ